MRVICVVNNVMPEVVEIARRKASYGGAWILTMADQFRKNKSIELSIALPGNVRKLIKHYNSNINYYIYPDSGYMRSMGGGVKGRDLWKEILEDSQPDIIYIFGTESGYPLELIRNCTEIPIIISLQGIINELQRYCCGGIDFNVIVKNITIADVLLGRGILTAKKRMKRSAVVEREILQKVKYVEGRSIWSKNAVSFINPNLVYHHCPRFIRSEFFIESGWNVSEVHRHSIFITQAKNPNKGLHNMLEALAILREKYPDVRLIVSGTNIVDRSTLRRRLLASGYSKIIRKMIINNNLSDHIEFVGVLDSNRLVNMLKKSHVAVLPSMIENSPNSLVEAMLVGVPCVASYVGGNLDIIQNNVDGFLYPHDEPIMLAESISRLFDSDMLCQQFSEEARKKTFNKHNPERIETTLIKIFEDVINGHKNE